MKKIFILFLILLFAGEMFAQTPTRTVNLTSSSWSAINKSNITDALSGLTSGTIWVAIGTYTETTELTIPPGVTVIGGFPATATTISDRIYPGATASQLTILSGSYAHRVATVQGTLDGCVIMKGYAFTNGTNGGGVLIDGGIVQNCILTNNIASKVASSPATIPGTYVASIGDIYCTDGTIVEPTYTINSNGNYVATFPTGYSLSSGSIITPKGTSPIMGIVFHVDPAATNRHFLILGIPGKNKIWFNCSGVPGQTVVDIPTVADITNQADAVLDFNGMAKTNAIVNQINTWISPGPPPWNWIGDWSNAEAPYYAHYYPSGTFSQWYLPAGGEILEIWNVYPQMDACAKLINWISNSDTMFSSSYFWTSTEYSDSKVWMLATQSYPSSPASLISYDKTTGGVAFPVASINY